MATRGSVRLSPCVLSRDWSAVTLYPAPQPFTPWPYSEANVLVNSHFDGLQNWQSVSGLDTSVMQSTTALDTAFSQNMHGVDYLRLNCAGHCWTGQAKRCGITVKRHKGHGSCL